MWEVGAKGSLPISISEGLALLPFPLHPNTMARSFILVVGYSKQERGRAVVI